MPGTNLSNILYRLALPFNPVRPERRPELIVQGNPLHDSESYLRILRRHHVLGSSTLLKDNDHQTVIHCSSQSPEHQVTDSSMFRVASITKMAAALAVFAAAE